MSHTYMLPARLDLPTAVPLLTELRAGGPDIVLDFEQVTHLGALCLQVLISAARAFPAGLTMINMSDDIAQQLAWMGLSPQSLQEGCP